MYFMNHVEWKEKILLKLFSNQKISNPHTSPNEEQIYPSQKLGYNLFLNSGVEWNNEIRLIYVKLSK